MIRRWLAAEGLRWTYAFYMTLAYLASHMDDHLAVAKHESAAYEAQRRLDQLSIQP
jgi:hypothetical protein